MPFPSPGIFLTQESNPGLLNCRQILYRQLWGKPFIINKLYYLLLISSCIPFNCLTESFRGDKNDVLYFSKIYLWRCFTQGNNFTIKGKALPELNCVNRWSLRTCHKNDSVVLLIHSVHWIYDYKQKNLRRSCKYLHCHINCIWCLF